MDDRLLSLDLAGLKSIHRAWKREARDTAILARDAARKVEALGRYVDALARQRRSADRLIALAIAVFGDGDPHE